jgi:hypothetical protein
LVGNDFFDLYAGQNWVLARIWDSMNGGRVFLTVDDGANWNQVSAAETDIDILTVATSTGSVLAGTWNGLYQLEPGGNSWDAMTATGMPADSAVRSMATVGDALYAGTLGGAYRSTDGGGTWADLSSEIPTDSAITAIVGSGDTVFLGTDNKGVLVAKSATESWAAANSGLTDPHVSQLAVMGTQLFAVTLTGVFVSNDSGASWAPDESGLEGVNSYLVLNNQLLAGTEASAVQWSSDGGGTFTALGTGMPSDARVWSLAATRGNIFAATDSGIWRLSCKAH